MIWHGAGILVAVIWVVSILVGDRVAEGLFGPKASPAIHNLTVEWLAAGLTLALALLLRLQRTTTKVDPETGQEVVTRPRHALFWIPVIAWPGVFFVLGVLVYFKTPAPLPAILDVTPAAVAQIERMAASRRVGWWHVRIEAYWKKGLAGPDYDITIDRDLNRVRDYPFEANGIKVVVLKRQVEMLRGAQVDFVDEERRFRVDNPNFEGDKLKKWKGDLHLERPAAAPREPG